MNIISRKSFWITLLVSLLVILTVGLLRINSINQQHSPVVTQVSTFDKFIPFLLGSLISCLLVIYIFKQGEQDGTELLIAAKPVARGQIIAGKFMVLISMLIGVQVLLFCVTYGYAQYDKYAFPIERLRFASSIAIGGLIIQLIASSFAAFIIRWLTNVALIILTILASSIIPIASTIIAPLAGGTSYRVDRLKVDQDKISYTPNIESYIKELSDLYKKEKPKDADDFKNKIDDKMNVADLRGEEDFQLTQTLLTANSIQQANHFFDIRWYDKIAYVDLWYQWSGFFDILMKDGYTNRYDIQDWYIQTKVANYEAKFSVDPTDDVLKNIFLVIDQTSINIDYIKSETIYKTLDEMYSGKSIVGGKPMVELFKDGEKSFEERFNAIRVFTQNNGSSTSYASVIVYNLLKQKLKEDGTYAKPKYETIAQSKRADHKKIPRTLKERKSTLWLITNGDEVQYWATRPFVKRSIKVYIWTSIAVLLLALTILVYYRRDFK